jgi:hypothetical protein
MKRNFYLMIAFAVWTGVMVWAGSGVETIGKGGITKAGLAMEFASSTKDIDNAFKLKTDAASAMKDAAPSVDTLKKRVRRQQYLDFVFIALYGAVFYLVIGRTLRESEVQLARRLGTLVGIFIIVAAVADYLEDFAILHVLCSATPRFWPLWFGLPKWIGFFLAMGCSAGLFLQRTGNRMFSMVSSAWFSFLLSVSGILLLAGGLLGLVGVAAFFCECGQLIPLGTAFILLPMIVLLVQCGRNAGIFGHVRHG